MSVTVTAVTFASSPNLSHLTWQRIQSMPKIEASSVKALWLALFDETIAGMLVVGALILAGFGLLIAVGVVYNSARVAFQERAWELASLRILGFTPGRSGHHPAQRAGVRVGRGDPDRSRRGVRLDQDDRLSARPQNCSRCLCDRAGKLYHRRSRRPCRGGGQRICRPAADRYSSIWLPS